MGRKHACAILSSLLALATLSGVPIHAQAGSGGFVVTLGADTVQLERFQREPRRWSGIVIARAPRFRRTEWSMTFDDAGRPAHYEARATDANGTPMLNGASGALTMLRDSVVRDGYRNGALETDRIATGVAPWPSPSLPFLGVSFLLHGESLQAARRRFVASRDSITYGLSLVPAQRAVSRTLAWFPAPDSAELNYFGVARSGYRFDSEGMLLRSDWTRTTYAYLVGRTQTDVLDAVAARWSTAELGGAPFGALSGRDSIKATAAGSDITIDYGRPRTRGRTIWGGLVPWDRVWRLGADMATHLSTSSDIMLGQTRIPAGRYTLWLLPSERGAQLIVNRAVNIFGTNYLPAQDLARIPMESIRSVDAAESLALRITTGALEIHWSTHAWRVPLSAP